MATSEIFGLPSFMRANQELKSAQTPLEGFFTAALGGPDLPLVTGAAINCSRKPKKSTALDNTLKIAHVRRPIDDILVLNFASAVQSGQGGVHRLHAQVLPGLKGRINLVDFFFTNQVSNGGRRYHHFSGDATTTAFR